MDATRKSRSREDVLPPGRLRDPVELLALQLLKAGVGPGTRVCLAFSGGQDSTALLHALFELRPRLGFHLSAAHVDHGLQAASGQWAQHCQALAAELQVALIVLRVEVPAGPSPEAQARAARYAALASVPCDRLLLAHHRDDQAESVLLALLRGSGPAGLAAMGASDVPPGHPLHARLLRPWLALDAAVLADWARQRGLVWIEDPSNQDLRLDRNYLRHAVGPLLGVRHPGWRAALARSARWAAEASGLMNDLAAQDLMDLQAGARAAAQERLPDGRAAAPERLPDGLAAEPAPLPGAVAADAALLPGAVADWQALGPARGRNLLRWLLHCQGLPPPPAPRLEAWWGQLDAASDRLPELAWAGLVLRRWRARLWLEPALDTPALPPDRPSLCAAGGSPEFPWLPGGAGGLELPWPSGAAGSLELPHAGCLVWQPASGHAASEPRAAGRLRAGQGTLRVTACRGSDALRVAPGGPTRELRKLFQEHGIPPWRRSRIPALRDGAHLVAVPGLAVAAGYQAEAGAPAWQLGWHDTAQRPVKSAASPQSW